MHTSNSVSTIFRCMLCSYGTRSQSSYAEHIKHCTNEPEREASSTHGDGKDKQTDNPAAAKRPVTSYVCKECFVPMGSTKALLLHLRDVHGKVTPIFGCKFCSRYAAETAALVLRHAKRLHPEAVLEDKVYVEISSKSEVNEPTVNSMDESHTAVTSADASQGSTTHNGPVKSSRSLGLHFLGKQFSNIGCDGFVCQLCSFSHVVSRLAVKHIWEDHADKLTEYNADAIDDDAVATNVLYKCDDCAYSTQSKCYFYNHCSHHRFNGPAKCPHCNYCALKEAAIAKHVNKYHDDVQPVINEKTSASNVLQKKSTNKAKCHPRKKTGKNNSKGYRTKRIVQKCPYCSFKSSWGSSIYRHKLSVHPQLINSAKKPIKKDHSSPGAVTSKSSSCEKSQIESSSDTANTSEKQFTCDICTRQYSTWRTFTLHKQVHIDLRRYKCSVCGQRSNYRSNTYKHTTCMHKGNKAHVICMSLEDARQTIDEYKKTVFKQSSRKPAQSSASVPPNETLSSSDHDKVRAEHNYTSMSMLTNSFQPAKRPKVAAKCNRSNVYGTKAKLKKYYVCSLCKQRSNHKSSTFRHIRTVHSGKARIIMKTEKSRAFVVRKTSDVQKLNVSKGSGKKVYFRHRCDVCPYKTNKPDALALHSAMHTKRPGYDYACNKCPYFACQAIHLERHVKLHDSAQSSDMTKNTVGHDFKGVFACEHCPFKAAHRKGLLCHIQFHCQKNPALRKCRFCSFRAFDLRSLQSHLKLHTTESSQMDRNCDQPSQSQQSNSLSSDVIEKHKVITSHLYSSNEGNEVDALSAHNAENVASRKLDDLTQNDSVNESAVHVDSALDTGQDSDVTARCTSSSAVNRCMPSWFCERCPYSAKSLPAFKRHVWLHGKHFLYECCYCDYSVQSYWQLVSHILWHFEPNRHLLYSQSVSNLDTLPSQLLNRESVPDSVASIDKYMPSFENSDVFVLSDASIFQCHFCPFLAEHRADFFAHMICHCVRTGYGCAFCNFHCDTRENITEHALLHFNLPGSRQSAIPPNVCQDASWKQLAAAIDTIAEKGSAKRTSSSISEPTTEVLMSLKTDTPVAIIHNTEFTDPEDKLSVDEVVNSFRVIPDKDEDTCAVSAVSQHIKSDAQAADFEQADKKQTYTAVPTDNPTSLMMDEEDAKFCPYCDICIDDPNELSKHKSAHLIGSFY